MFPTPDAKIKGCHSTAIVDSSKLSWAVSIWLSKLTSWEPRESHRTKKHEIIFKILHINSQGQAWLLEVKQNLQVAPKFRNNDSFSLSLPGFCPFSEEQAVQGAFWSPQLRGGIVLQVLFWSWAKPRSEIPHATLKYWTSVSHVSTHQDFHPCNTNTLAEHPPFETPPFLAFLTSIF